MIRLDNTTRSLVLSLAGNIQSNQLQIVANYSDNNGTTYTGGTKTTLSNNTSYVTIVAAPAASTVRDIDNIAIYNKDNVSSIVNVLLNDNSTYYQIINTILQTGESLLYTHGQGQRAVDINGCTKTSIVSQSAENLIGTPSLPNGTSATTQTLGDASTKIATDQFVSNAMAQFSLLNNSINQVTVNFGTQPLNSGNFTMSNLGGLSIGQPVIVLQAATRPNETLSDNIEMDQISVTGIATSAEVVKCNQKSKTRVCNQYTFNYQI